MDRHGFARDLVDSKPSTDPTAVPANDFPGLKVSRHDGEETCIEENEVREEHLRERKDVQWTSCELSFYRGLPAVSLRTRHTLGDYEARSTFHCRTGHCRRGCYTLVELARDHADAQHDHTQLFRLGRSTEKCYRDVGRRRGRTCSARIGRSLCVMVATKCRRSSLLRLQGIP